MKKKSTSQLAFFNLRVLLGLLVGMTGVSLALFAADPFGRGTGPTSTSSSKMAQLQQKYNLSAKSGGPVWPVGFDCSKIHELGFHKMENFAAQRIQMYCAQLQGGKASHARSPGKAFSKFVQSLMAPLAFGSTDVDLITGTETFPSVTQSETYTMANPDNPSQIVVAFNDSSNAGLATPNYAGASVSTDGGTTFTRLNPNPFASAGINLGDPIVLFNKQSQTWYTIWIDCGCGCGFPFGSAGLGVYSSTNPSDPNSWTHLSCVHNNTQDDRESAWVENNPSSPFFGRMYVSWNDFNVGGGALFSTFSSDNGATWHSPVTVSNTGTFIRDVQITGDMSGNGTIYIAGMDEGGGLFPHNDTNHIFKSTDGGVSWAHPYTGPSFPGPGVADDGNYFACMFPDNGCYWRHEGWGEPGAFNNVVHLVYSQHGTGSDPGDVYYIRSTDGGSSFGTPLKLNTDATTRPQWQVNLSVSPSGTLLATWYDARDSASCTSGNPAVPCYRMYSRKSNDNGQSWLPDDTLSDVVSPLPTQPDDLVQPTYAGDYDYGTAIASKHLTSWVDGRVAISGTSQQDAFTDRDLVGFSVTSTDPACGSLVTGTAPTVFTVDLSDPVDPLTVDAVDFTVNGTSADSAGLSNGDQTIAFTFDTSPVTAGENTMHIPAGAFNQASNNDPVLEFQCTFNYTQVQLEVTDTDPPVGGTFTPPAPGTYDYRVNWNKAVDESSVQDTDLQLSGNTGATVTGHTFENGDTTIHFTLNITFGGPLTAHIAAGAITDGDGNPNADFLGDYTVSGCPPTQYVITPGTDTIVPGTTDTGNHTDDGSTFVSLPFSFTLYDQTFNGVNVDSNGRLDFVCNGVPPHGSDWIAMCLPATDATCPYTYTVFPAWTDQCTDNNANTCGGTDPRTGCGIFTSVEGSPGSQIFHIEWRTVLFASSDTAPTVHFEVNLFENSGQFEVVYGDIGGVSGAPQMWVGGVQKDEVSGFFTQDFCNPLGQPPPGNVSKTYEIPACASPTPSPTPSITPSATPTATPTATATATPSVTPSATPTATPRATPRPRPTPHPRPTPP
jgi:hypothetical protein